MIQVNRGRLKAEFRNLGYADRLEEFLEKTALLKPLCTFEVADKDVQTRRFKAKPEDTEYTTVSEIKRIRVYENGQRIGSIAVSERYRGRTYEPVYEVESFRICNFRGNRNSTQTKDLKSAMRTIKVQFEGRKDDELKELIKNHVSNGISSVHGTAVNQLRWDFSIEKKLCNYAILAYEARRRGDKTCQLPATPITIGRPEVHDQKCEAYIAINQIYEMLKSSKGYGIKTNHDKSIHVYNLETQELNKYESYQELPEHIGSKYAVFNVLDENEPQPNIGIKFPENYCYVVV